MFKFKKHLKNLILSYIGLISGFVIIVFSFVMFVDNFLNIFSIAIIFIFFIVIIYNFYKSCTSLRKFIKNYTIEEMHTLERELNNALLEYNGWFLTDQYIFCLEKLKFIKYTNIILVEYKKTVETRYNRANLIHKQIIYLNDGKKYVFQTPYADYIYYKRFVEIIKYRNLDVLIGNKNKYRNQIKEKYNIDI